MVTGAESDELNEKLLEPDFDVVQYVNSILAMPTISSQGAGANQDRASQLKASATEVQTHTSRLNGYNARTSTELTGLTDEILRSSNRLAYEVEVLRSDANSLFDLLSETLRDEIQLFVNETSSTSVGDGESEAVKEMAVTTTNDPEFMQQLRLLGHVKSRLEEVIRVFGDALQWPIPPSDVSMASSLISVSAPELGVVSTAEDDKARAIIRAYREELVDLLASDGGGQAGLEAAQKRLKGFQDLALVWRGTAEEKARNRVVEGFSKIVEDRRRTISSQIQQRRSHVDAARTGAQAARSGTPSLPTGGLLGGLRKLRDEIYLD